MMPDINKTFKFQKHSGAKAGIPDAYIQFATTSVESHMNIYFNAGHGTDNLCFDPDTGKAIAKFLAVTYGLVPDEDVEVRSVVVNSNGEFIRFA